MSTHRCLAGRHCRRATDGQPAATAIADSLCPGCDRWLRTAIRQLPRDFVELYAALGEHGSADGPKIHSTPTPKAPISIRREALMSSIAEAADRAAGVVAAITGSDWDTIGRKPPQNAARGSIAWCAASRAQRTTASTVTAAIALIEPNLRRLAAAPAEVHAVWDTNGADRRYTDLTGMQLAANLADLHHQTRAELGKTRLREYMTMPCPDCGGRVYRDDGQSIVVCEDDPRHTCTEREHKVRAGLRIEERTYEQMANWFLAEGYWRLDRVQKLIDTMRKDPDIEQPSAGPLILDALQQILDAGAEVDGKQIGHQRPAKRASGTDKRAAAQRQVDEDNWTWRTDGQERYKPPRRRTRRKSPSTAPKVNEASRSTLIDLDLDAALKGK